VSDTLILVGFLLCLYVLFVLEVGRHLGRNAERYPEPPESDWQWPCR
jgi:hypothetical protein